MRVVESQLSDSIKKNIIYKMYFLYGKEPYLTKLYADKVVKKAVGDDPMEFNLVRLSGNPDFDELNEQIDGLPYFSDKKAIVINDFDPEKLDNDTQKKLIQTLSDIPDTSVVVIYVTGIPTDAKKAKTKKLISAIESSKDGIVCEFDTMPMSKVQTLIAKKAARLGCSISQKNAEYLAELTLLNINLIGSELDKLCAYVGEGEITAEIIDKLVSKQLDAGIYTLAAAITAGNRTETFRILDELIKERIEPVVIMSALSGTFVDFYRAKIGKKAGKTQYQIAADFSYPANRSWVINKALGTVSRLDVRYLRNCVTVLSKADLMLKSTAVDNRIIMEQTIAQLFA